MTSEASLLIDLVLSFTQVPGGLIEMGAENFIREGRELLSAIGIKGLPTPLKSEVGAKASGGEAAAKRREMLSQLTLNNKVMTGVSTQRLV